jgi:small GTP-binding protein
MENGLRKVHKKVCLLGDFAVGKTSLVRRYVYNRFDDKYISTIGVKVNRKTVMIASGSGVIDLTMMLWDLAGSEEFDRMRSSYLRGAAGAIWVCDLTRPQTLDCLDLYAEILFDVAPGAQLVLAANKCDLVDESRVAPSRMQALADRFGVLHFRTSAKLGDEVEAVFDQLGQLLVAHSGGVG